MQMAFALVKQLLPAKVAHLLRRHASPIVDEMIETLDGMLQNMLKAWLAIDMLTPRQQDIAHALSIWGYWLAMIRSASTACASSVTILGGPGGSPTHTQVASKMPKRVRPSVASILCSGGRAAPMLRDLGSRPDHLKEKVFFKRLRLLSSIHVCELLAAEPRDADATVAAGNRHTGYTPTLATQTSTGTGQWFVTLPTNDASLIRAATFAFGLKQCLGVPLNQALHNQCAILHAGHARGAPLDMDGYHASTCDRRGIIHRHHALRDLVAKFACKAGLIPITEPQFGAECPMQPDGSSPVATAEVHIPIYAGLEMWLDMHIVSTCGQASLPDFLAAQERRLEVPAPGEWRSPPLCPLVCQQSLIGCASNVLGTCCSRKCRGHRHAPAVRASFCSLSAWRC